MLVGVTALPTMAVADAGRPVAARAPAIFVDSLSFVVAAISPTLVTATGPATLTISGTMTNTRDEPLTDVIARVQRGDALKSPDELAAELASPGNPETTWSDFVDVVPLIDPGATVPFSIQAPLYGALRDTLAVTEPGVYPIMVNVNANFASAPSQNGARIGEVHLLLTVASIKAPQSAEPSDPTQPTVPTVPTGPASPPAAGTRQGVNLVLPLVDRPHRDPTGAFFDDDLAASIRPGGRLDAVLSAAESASLIPGATTLAVDPALLEDLTLMSTGYTVGPFVLDLTRVEAAASTSASISTSTSASISAGTGAPTTGPSSTTSSSTSPSSTSPGPSTTGGPSPVAGTMSGSGGATATAPDTYVPVPGPTAVPGTGTQSAVDFLARIRVLAAKTPVLVLPYSDTDGVAVVRANLTSFLTGNIARGRTVATDVLGSAANLVTDVAWPVGGLVDAATLDAYRRSGQNAALISQDSLKATPTAATALLRTPSGTVDAIVAAPGMPTGAGAINTLAAATAINFFSNISRSAVFAAERQWQPDSAGLAALSGLLAQLRDAGMVSGVDLQSVIRQSPAGEDAVSYPGSAAATELNPDFLERLQSDLTTLSSVQAVFTPTGTVAPGDQATTAPGDLFADLINGVRRQASAGFRSEPVAANTSMGAIAPLVDQVEAGVWITPPQGRFTLTSNSSPLLVTVRNDLPYNAHVVIRFNLLDASRAGVTIDNNAVRDIPAGRTVQILVPATITRSGTFTLRTQLAAPDGRLWGAQQTLTLTSTAYGAFTLWMIIVAAVVLVLTSARRIYLRGKERKLRIAQGLQ